MQITTTIAVTIATLQHHQQQHHQRTKQKKIENAVADKLAQISFLDSYLRSLSDHVNQLNWSIQNLNAHLTTLRVSLQAAGK
jgi:peptidoglycan hydrolase CwlO-like protein